MGAEVITTRHAEQEHPSAWRGAARASARMNPSFFAQQSKDYWHPSTEKVGIPGHVSVHYVTEFLRFSAVCQISCVTFGQ